MTNEEQMQEIAFALLINPLPAPARSRLLRDETFSAKFGSPAKFFFPLDKERSIETKSLHRALRAAVNGRKTARLTLSNGRHANAKLRTNKSGEALLQFDGRNFSFLDAGLLSGNRKTRTAAIRRVLSERPLLASEEDIWRDRAGHRALSELEYMELMTDLSETPEALAKELRERKNFKGDDLIPDEPAYYHRLTAPLRASRTLPEFIANELLEARKTLLARHPKAALRRVAFSALWQPLIPFTLLSEAPKSDIETLIDAEDPFSLLFGFELCRARVVKNQAFLKVGSALLQKLLLDARSEARCNVYSSCALISTINLRRAAKASSAPLFWVRLAALTHAGVLANALGGMPNTETFLKWALENFYPSYVWNGAIDRRDAPRWNPEWISPDHLYAELVGRAHNALVLLAEGERPPLWVATVTAAIERLKGQQKLAAMSFAGPFDDWSDNQATTAPLDVFKEIETNLETAAKLSDVEGLFALANTVKPSESMVTNMVRILSRPTDELVADQHELSFVRVCAQIACNARSGMLAAAVVNRCIAMARKPGRKEGITDIFEVMTEAGGAYENHPLHRKEVGKAATKICFATDDRADLNNLSAVFDVLKARDEKLTPSLSRAEAVINTKLGRN